MLAIIGASGKIGGATLSSLLEYKLIPPSKILCTTSSQPNDPKWTSLASKGVQVRHATFDDSDSMEKALTGCERLFLVSSPRIQMDYFNASYGSGREKDHFVVLDAAKKVGVKHVYYTSLAFANPSKSNVMTAHERTEERLKEMEKAGMGVTIIREGLYNESWPLYFGHYSVKGDDRDEVLVAGDGKISWTSIADLGVANALVLAKPVEQYEGKTFYLSNTREPKSLKEIAEMVSKAKGKKVELKIVPTEEHEKYYIEKRGMNEGHIKWWAKTYDALKDEECLIKDNTLEKLLDTVGKKPKPVEETVREMLS